MNGCSSEQTRMAANVTATLLKLRNAHATSTFSNPGVLAMDLKGLECF